jgi:hypothetical protein
VNLRKNAQSKVNPQKPTNSADTIDSRDKSLTLALKAARQGAKQGEIFTPEAIALFASLSRHHLTVPTARRYERVAQFEPVRVHLKINEDYPSTIPVQSMPPSVLMNLPQLPKEVEYRIVGRDLVLLDVGTNLVVDIAPNVVPSS